MRSLRWIFLVVLLVLPTSLGAQSVLVHDNPWGLGSTFESSWNDVFGVGGWSHYGYSGLNAATLFSPANSFIYLEGGAATDVAFRSFVEGNATTISNWVSGGGRLVLNAATWGEWINTPFGLTITSDFFETTGNLSPGAEPLGQNWGYGSPGQQWVGRYFAHGEILGGSYYRLLQGQLGQALLVSQVIGAGVVLTGALTPEYFWGVELGDPSPGAQALARNILGGAAYYGQGQVVPEPATVVLLGTGLLALGIAARYRRREEEE